MIRSSSLGQSEQDFKEVGHTQYTALPGIPSTLPKQQCSDNRVATKEFISFYVLLTLGIVIFAGRNPKGQKLQETRVTEVKSGHLQKLAKICLSASNFQLNPILDPSFNNDNEPEKRAAVTIPMEIKTITA
jgi:hypothetical protein